MDDKAGTGRNGEATKFIKNCKGLEIGKRFERLKKQKGNKNSQIDIKQIF